MNSIVHDRFPITMEGRAALQDELERRIKVERPHFIERLQQALDDDANLAENAEYQAVLGEQEINEARIADLEDKLTRADVIDVATLSGDSITFGATVSLVDEDNGEKKTVQIVGEPEADAKHGKISVRSPVARALIGKNTGDTIEVETPGGIKTYQVRGIRWIEDRQGNAPTA